VPAQWSPSLRVIEHRARCRLCLGSYAWGEGSTLQEAADDLVRRLLNTALSWRSAASFRFSAEMGPPDLAWWEFVDELATIAADGADIRPRVFGATGGLAG
jgi:hypothetical protein